MVSKTPFSFQFLQFYLLLTIAIFNRRIGGFIPLCNGLKSQRLQREKPREEKQQNQEKTVVTFTNCLP